MNEHKIAYVVIKTYFDEDSDFNSVDKVFLDKGKAEIYVAERGEAAESFIVYEIVESDLVE